MYDKFTSIRPAVIDEISLEGLDGITCEALWTRLSDRLIVSLPFPKPLCNEVWNIILTSDEIEIFELPRPRDPFILFDRYEHVDPVLGMVIEPDELPPVIYVNCPVEDKVNNIRGSCSTYYTRVNITNEAKEMTLDEALEKWGMKLILVANQKARNQSIFGWDFCPGIELTIIQYCILERVGRSRYQGEVTQGKISLSDMNIEAKSMFYHRKSLMKYNLITKQVHHQKSGAHNTAGTLLHLPRFYVERKPKACYLTAEVMEILREKPNFMAEYDEIKKKLGMENSLRKLFKTIEFQRFVKTDIVMPYRALYPDAQISEWKHKGSDREKSIRVVQIVDPELDVLDSWTKDEDQEPTEDNALLDYSKVLLDRSMVSQAYHHIEEAGSFGLTQTELGKKMGQHKLCARMICRRLQGMKLVITLLEDVGRQRVSKYVSCKYSDSNMATMFKAERNKMVDFLKTSKKFVPAIPEPDSQNPMVNDLISVPSNLLTEELLLMTDENSNDSTNSTPNDTDEGKEDEVNVTFIETKVNPGVKGYSVGVIDSMNVGFPDNNKKDTCGISYRLLKRANLIIESVRSNQVITDPTKLMKLIQEEETSEGYLVKFDKKSLLRMLMKLSKDGYLKIIQAKLETKLKKKKKTLTFICECDVTTKHSIILSELEQAKMKLFILPQMKLIKVPVPEPVPDKDLSKFTSESIAQSMEELKQIGNRTVKTSFIYDAKLSKKYGYQPKMVRMRLMHNLLFHMVYCNIGEPIDQSATIDFLESQGHEVTPELLSQLSPIYTKEISWKMFIPPLPSHCGWPQGWTIMCDILLRLPLSIFLQVCNISYAVPNIDEYIEHPIKKHTLVKHLPIDIRNDLTMARKYIFSIHEIIMRLCYIGLAQFGPQRLKEKDQVFVYLNRRAMLCDTRNSEPGYHQTTEQDFPCTRYEFRNITDLDKYWCEFWDISIHTNLGMRNTVYGQQIILEKAAYKASLLEAVKPREPEDAIEADIGYIPGDKRGAAGVDSSMFVHLKRNWHWTNISAGHYQPYRRGEGSFVRDAKMKTIQRSKFVFKEIPCNKKINAATLQTGTGLMSKTTKKRTVKKPNMTVVKKNVSMKKNIVRNVAPRRSRRRPAYDEIDKQALLRMSKLRVDWHPNEDRLLLLCKVGLMFLFPDWRKITVGLHIVRDIMHRVTHSYNKTSKACQRRILYIMKNPKTENSVRLCLEEIRWSPEISRNFGHEFMKKYRDEAIDHADYVNKINIHYIELITVLRKTFSRLGGNLCPFSGMLPRTITDFEERYTIRTSNDENNEDGFSEPNSISDIQRSVIRTVIHSSLCSVKDKTRWNYQLYNIYKQYPDHLLRSMLAKLRTSHMVAVKKNIARSLIRTGNLPLSSAPFQLSITYENQMRSKYVMSTFRESNVMLQKLIRHFEDKETRGVHIAVTDGGTASGLSELSIGFLTNYEICIPEQVVILDPRIREDDPTYERILQRYRDILRTNVSQNAPGQPDSESDVSEDEESTRSIKIPKLVPIAPEADVKPSTSTTSQQMIKKPSEAILTPQGRVALSMMRLEGIDADPEAKQHLHDYFVVNSSNLYVSLITRDGKLTLTPELLQNEKKCSEKFLNSIKESGCIKDVSKNEEDSILEKIFSDQDEQSETLKEIAGNIVQFVKSKNILGTTNQEIIDQFQNSLNNTTMDLLRILALLYENQLILRVGICEPRYVHKFHAEPWLVHTSKLLRLDREKLPIVDPSKSNKRKRNSRELSPTEPSSTDVESKRQKLDTDEMNCDIDENSESSKSADETSQEPKIPSSIINELAEIQEGSEYIESVSEPLNISISPWIRVDGTVNRRVLDQWLSTVLSYCIALPGITLKAVQDKYNYQLPFHTRELVEILVQLKCLHLQKIIRTSTNLFSKTSHSTLEKATGLENSSQIIIMPLENAILKFGVFIGERAYATSFLTHVK